MARTRTSPSTPEKNTTLFHVRELEVVQLLGVVLDPVGGPGPEQVDQHDRDELEEVQVHPGPRAGCSGDWARIDREELGGIGRGGERRGSGRGTSTSTRDGRIIADLSPERCSGPRPVSTAGDREPDSGRPAVRHRCRDGPTGTAGPCSDRDAPCVQSAGSDPQAVGGLRSRIRAERFRARGTRRTTLTGGRRGRRASRTSGFGIRDRNAFRRN